MLPLLQFSATVMANFRSGRGFLTAVKASQFCRLVTPCDDRIHAHATAPTHHQNEDEAEDQSREHPSDVTENPVGHETPHQPRRSDCSGQLQFGTGEIVLLANVSICEDDSVK